LNHKGVSHSSFYSTFVHTSLFRAFPTFTLLHLIRLAVLKRVLSSPASYWPGKDSTPSSAPRSPGKGTILPRFFVSSVLCVSISKLRLLHPEVGGSKVLWNVGTLHHFTYSILKLQWLYTFTLSNFH